MNSRQNKAVEDAEDADGSHWQENLQSISTVQNSGSCAVTKQQFSQLISQQHQMNLQQQQMTIQLQQIMMQQKQLMQKQEEMMNEIQRQLNGKLPLTSGTSSMFSTNILFTLYRNILLYYEDVTSLELYYF